MNRDATLTILFIGIFIWLIYSLAFALLHGKLGFLAWFVLGICALLVGLVKIFKD